MIESCQIVQENTTKKYPKKIRGSIYDTVHFKIFIGALQTEKIHSFRKMYFFIQKRKLMKFTF